MSKTILTPLGSCDAAKTEDALMSKSETKQLCRSGQLIKKTRILWQYAPDKMDIWLEKMAHNGYHLVRMSNMGFRFFFLRGEPYQAKFHVDYQRKPDPSYFNLNKDAGWKLFSNPLSAYQNLSVWGQEYTDEPPLFYSDSESKIKHARNFALSYSILFIPLCLLYMFSVARNINRFPHYDLARILEENLMLLISILIFGFYATRTILYYFRVKKSVTKD